MSTPRRAAPPSPRDLHFWLGHLERHLAEARRRDQPEDVHQVRVAARRLRATLELQGHAALVGDLQALCRTLGPARDLHLAARIPQLRAWAQARAAEARRTVLEVAASARTRGLLEALRALPAGPTAAGQRELKRRTRAVRRALARWDGAAGADRVEATHPLRRQVRRLRYAREALGLPAEAVAGVQDALGGFCDLLALRRLLASWAQDTGADAKGALARLDRALSEPPAPPPPPGSPARRPARSRGARRAPSPSAR